MKFIFEFSAQNLKKFKFVHVIKLANFNEDDGQVRNYVYFNLHSPKSNRISKAEIYVCPYSLTVNIRFLRLFIYLHYQASYILPYIL